MRQLPVIQPDAAPAGDDAGASTATAVRYRVEGMDCGACARTLERVVGALDGVDRPRCRSARRPCRCAATCRRSACSRPCRARASGPGRSPSGGPRRRRSGGTTGGRCRRSCRCWCWPSPWPSISPAPSGSGRAGVPGVDGDRRLADRAGGDRGAAPPLARHERADGARGGGSRRDRLVRRGCVGAGAVRARHDAGDVRARSHAPLGRVAGRAGARRGAGARRRARSGWWPSRRCRSAR